MSSNYLRAAYQDSYGFLWLASYEGLIRWDGYTFKRYTYEDGRNTISSNIAYCVFEDKEKRLWVGTITGLNLLDRQTDSFIKCDIHASIKQVPVNAIAEDSKGQLWLATSSGLCKYNFDGKESQWFIQGNVTSNTANKDVIFCMTIDDQDNLWLGTNGGGVQKFDQVTEKFTSINNQKGDDSSICSNDIRSIMADRDGNIWIGSKHDGISLLNVDGKVIRHFRNFLNQKTSTQSTINCIYQDKSGRIWFGIDREPLYYLNEITEQPLRTAENQNALNVHNIPHSISSICEDSFNNIWFASSSHGLFSMNPGKNVFKNYLNDPGLLAGLRSNVVTSMYEDKAGIIWIGTEEGGLIKFNPKTAEYSSDPLAKKLTSEGITDIKGDKNGNLWLSTWSGGIVKFNPATSAFQAFTHDEFDLNSLVYNDVKSILVDDTIIWIGTHGAGLAAYDIKKKKFIDYKSNNVYNVPLDEPGWINHLYKDSKGILWISTYSGLFTFDGKELRRYQHSEDRTTLSNNSVRMVIEDNAGRIWVLSGANELDEFLRTTNQFIRQRESLASIENIRAIATDEKGFLWITTSDGVYKIHPDFSKLQRYDRSDGLQQDDFFERAILLTKEGSLYMGGLNGFSTFHPENLNAAPLADKFYFTNLYVFNEIQKPGEKGSPLTEVLHLTEKLTLNHHHSFFSVEFSNLNLYSPGKVTYSYMLKGLHNQWINIQNERKVSFTNLDPGNYELIVRYTDSNGEWVQSNKTLSIRILPPWWKTLWFKVLILFLILAAIITVFYLRLSYIKKRNKILKREVEERTRELQEANSFLLERSDQIERQHEKIKLQNEKLEIYNQEVLTKSEKILFQQQHITAQNYQLEKTVEELQKLNETKDHFFSILAHDLKNPIAGLTGIAEYLKTNFSRLDKKDTQDHLVSIHKSCTAVYNLLINLLNWSRTQSKNIECVPVNFDLFELIQKNAALMEQQFTLKNIELEIVGGENFQAFADYNMMDAVVRNLISNSIKFTDYNGKVKISASATANAVTLKINDSGVGLSKSQIDRLFTLSKNNISRGTAGEQGTGLGLVISQEYIKANNGTIYVESELGKGSTFFITVPRAIDTSPTLINNFRSDSLNGKTSIDFWEKYPIEKLMRLKGQKILIVDDNKELRTYLKFLLSSTFELYEAENGADALTIALEIQPSVIISDLIMPIMDGAQFANRIKTTTATSHIPVILLTSQATEEGQLMGYESGADVYLTKPVKKEILIRVILNCIQSQEKVWKKVQESLLDVNSTIIPDLSINVVDEEFLKKVIAFIEENISNPNIDTDMLCKYIGMSRTSMYSKIKTLTGQGVHEFVKSIRMKRSLKLLLEEKLSIGQITLEVGFTSQSYFNKCFQKQYEMSPREYVAARKNKNAIKK